MAKRSKVSKGAKKAKVIVSKTGHGEMYWIHEAKKRKKQERQNYDRLQYLTNKAARNLSLKERSEMKKLQQKKEEKQQKKEKQKQGKKKQKK